MYKPAPIREFVTPAVHKKATKITVNNRTRKEFVEVGTARGKFKQKGTAETNANGLTVINEKTTFTTSPAYNEGKKEISLSTITDDSKLRTIVLAKEK